MTRGYLCLILHAHLPFVRHPEQEKFLEESWLFEAITETYLPLLQRLQAWQKDALPARLALTLSPTLCAMLHDELLQERYRRYLKELIELADKEIHRTSLEKVFHPLALFYYQRLTGLRSLYQECHGDLLGAFGALQAAGRIEIITSSATHAILPLLLSHPAAVRAQILVAKDSYQRSFGCEPRGIWLPECAYDPGLDAFLREANLRWFVLDSHGLMRARPRPRYALFAPVFTAAGVAAFGRDRESARQVWSRHEGYPGDPRYRDFYRDIGFDLDFDYVRPYLSAAEQRGFTGLKYHRITGGAGPKAPYDPAAAHQAAQGHAAHFLAARCSQIQRLAQILDRPPLLVAPYDAELFGHWWYEGPEFLDALVRQACASPGEELALISPEDYLRRHPTNQVAGPSASSWGEAGHWRVWLNETNQWIYPHLSAAQDRMTELVRRFRQPSALERRALAQAGRELLLAQASDWPFILRAGTSPTYARQRVQQHLQRFTALYEQLLRGNLDERELQRVEAQDNLFPDLDGRYWE